jgi:acetyl esterase/lipase
MRHSIVLCVVGTVLLAGSVLPAGGQGKTDDKVYKLWDKGAPGAKGEEAKDIPTVTVYLPPADKANGSAMVICPGGGYGALAMDHEGHQIAQWCNAMGMAGIILKYRIAPHYKHPSPLLDVQRALRFTRAHAKQWNIDPSRVGVIGFSAGGHLASTVGTHFDLGGKEPTDPIDGQSCRPDFLVLCYPVITFKGPFAHLGSRNNLLGKDADEKLVDSLCNDTQVTKETPQTFLVHTTEDKGVPPENSIFFYLALNKAKVPAEMHLFEKGQHGLGLALKQPNLPYAAWPKLCQAWLEGRGILKKGN